MKNHEQTAPCWNCGRPMPAADADWFLGEQTASCDRCVRATNDALGIPTEPAP